MKQRTFLTTLALFLFFFNLGIFIVSVAMFKDTLNRGEERSLSQHYFIASALIKDMQAVEGRGGDIDGSLNALLQPYGYFREIMMQVLHFTKIIKWSFPVKAML